MKSSALHNIFNQHLIFNQHSIVCFFPGVLWYVIFINCICAESQLLSQEASCVFPTTQGFELTRQGELRHNYVRELCMQPDGASLIAQDCVYPKAPVPTQQKWKFLPVSYRNQNKALFHFLFMKKKKTSNWKHRLCKDFIFHWKVSLKEEYQNSLQCLKFTHLPK